MKRHTAALLCLVIAACGDSNISRAKELVASQLLDPSSVQFRNVRVVDGAGELGEYVCGEVNGKNRFGGYVGFQRFAVSSDGSWVWIEDSANWDPDPKWALIGRQMDETLFRNRCEPQFVGNDPPKT